MPVGVTLPPPGQELVELTATMEHRSGSLVHRAVKRALDIVFSLVVCAMLLPVVLFFLMVVAMDTGVSPIYSEERVGMGGRTFRIFKFRTMVADAGDVEKWFTAEQMREWRLERKVTDDPRITRFGRFLRMTSLDELPQFFNVLTGDMSVVGPRAVTCDELRWFGDAQGRLLSVRPGITGVWQCTPRGVATFENGERQKIEVDYAYNASLGLDLRVALKTLSVMFVKRQGR